MAGWQDGKLTKWQVDEIAKHQILSLFKATYWVKKWQVGKMASRWNGDLIKCLAPKSELKWQVKKVTCRWNGN